MMNMIQSNMRNKKIINIEDSDTDSSYLLTIINPLLDHLNIDSENKPERDPIRNSGINQKYHPSIAKSSFSPNHISQCEVQILTSDQATPGTQTGPRMNDSFKIQQFSKVFENTTTIN